MSSSNHRATLFMVAAIVYLHYTLVLLGGGRGRTELLGSWTIGPNLRTVSPNVLGLGPGFPNQVPTFPVRYPGELKFKG